MKKFLVILFLIISQINVAQSRGVIKGFLSDKETNNEPLPFANIQIKEKNIIIILPTFDSLRLNKEIINKELTPLCNNIGYTTQLTNN